jgi:predicted acylesterase/phospholipase RssA
MKRIVILLFLVLSLISFSNKIDEDYGLVIAGGAAPVFKSVGFLQALSEEGFVPNEYIGTSMGSIVAYFLSAGYEPKDIIEVFKSIEYDKFFEMTFPLRGGLIHYDNFIDLIYSITGVDDFNEFIYPAKFGIQNFSEFKTEYWSEGNSLDALKASIALEVFFEPFKKNGKFYADVGVTDLFVKNPEKYFMADKIFMIRVEPKLIFDPKRNFYNIINILYGTIDLGSYHTNVLYNNQFLNYDYIFELEMKENIDPKSFFNSEFFYNSGYSQGIKFLKETNILDELKLERKNIEYKDVDFEKLYIDIKTESYFLPRDFYSNVNASLNFNNYFGKLYYYIEYMNNRVFIGSILDNEYSLNPYIELKNYYFPFNFNRMYFYFDSELKFEYNLRTYVLKKFRNIVYLDYFYRKDKNNEFNQLSLAYDNLYENYHNKYGNFIKFDNYFNNGKLDFDFSVKNITSYKRYNLTNEIGMYFGSHFKILEENIISDYAEVKNYYRSKIQYLLFNDLNLEMSQIIFINKLKTNFYFNLFLDDYTNFSHNLGFDLEVPINFAGIVDFNVQIGFNNISNKVKYYINFIE